MLCCRCPLPTCFLARIIATSLRPMVFTWRCAAEGWWSLTLRTKDRGAEAGGGGHGFGNEVLEVREVKPGDAGLEEERR